MSAHLLLLAIAYSFLTQCDTPKYKDRCIANQRLKEFVFKFECPGLIYSLVDDTSNKLKLDARRVGNFVGDTYYSLDALRSSVGHMPKLENISDLGLTKPERELRDIVLANTIRSYPQHAHYEESGEYNISEAWGNYYYDRNYREATQELVLKLFDIGIGRKRIVEILQTAVSKEIEKHELPVQEPSSNDDIPIND